MSTPIYNKDTDYAEFDSLLDYYEACNTWPFAAQADSGRQDANRHYIGHDSEGTRFYGTPSWAAAQKLATTGWTDGTARVEALAQKMSIKLVESVYRPTIKYDVTGEMFDMGIVMEGTPECWMKFEHDEGESTTGPVHIVFNVCVSAGLSTDVIEARGAAVAALVYILEAANRPVKVDAVIGGQSSWMHRGDSYHKSIRVTVKHFYDPMQLDALAYTLVHPSFFRRHGFAFGAVLGMDPKHYRPADAKHAPKGDIYISEGLYGEPHWTDVEATEKWLQKTLEAQGVKFKLS